MNNIYQSGIAVGVAVHAVVNKENPTLDELDTIKNALSDLRDDIEAAHTTYVAALESLNDLMPTGEELDPEGEHEAWTENFDEVAGPFYDMFGGE